MKRRWLSFLEEVAARKRRKRRRRRKNKFNL